MSVSRGDAVTDRKREPTDPASIDPESTDQESTDPGAFIGRKPERVEETIPGGLGRKDERAAAVATQSGPPDPEGDRPEGHREGPPVSDDTVREAGQNR
jgi:hypothetical protein